MSTFNRRPSQEGYMEIEGEKRRLALLVCAVKRMVAVSLEQNERITPEEHELIKGVGYDIYYCAKHFSLKQKDFEKDISDISDQFMEDGTYKLENEAFREENHEKIKAVKKELKKRRAQFQSEKDFKGNVQFSNTTKH